MTAETYYYNLSVKEIEEKLTTNATVGLSIKEAKKRLKQHGYNELKNRERYIFFIKVLNQSKKFIIIALLTTIIISSILGILIDEGFTSVILIIIIAVFSEIKGKKKFTALEKLPFLNSKVLRDDQAELIKSRNIIPGDIVFLEKGDTIPADMILIESEHLNVQEISVTGKSVLSKKNTNAIKENVQLKDRHNMVFSSCYVTYGSGKGIVVATGMNTEIVKTIYNTTSK